MTNNELKIFIKNYIENNKTHSAIMLTAPWGTGKSYFIQNELIPFLSQEENGDHKCIVVSLYGLKSLYDISKALYIESRIKFLANDSEKATVGKLAAQTIIKGVTSFFGIDLSKTPEEMQELYESIDLSGKLIILEDLERTNIDIIELLGYVNNLVEQDGVKVLLVANENQLINYEINGKPVEKSNEIDSNHSADIFTIGINSPKNKTPEVELSQSSIEYLKSKEKTISDTIIYSGNKEKEIKEILSDFPNLCTFQKNKCIEEICGMLSYCKCDNLRTFIFACQKASDIIGQISNKYSKDFKKCIFYSIILYATKIKSGKPDTDYYKMVWTGDEFASTTLGSDRYPLFYFCFNYIKNHVLLMNLVKEASEKYKKMLLFDPNTSFKNNDTEIVFSYYVQEENDVKHAIENIISDMEKGAEIPLYLYGKLACYFVQLKYNVGIDFDYEKARELFVKNLNCQNQNLKEELFFFGIEEKTDEAYKEFLKLKQEMIDSLNENSDNYFGFDYMPDSIISLSNLTKSRNYIEKGAFARFFDNQKIKQMLFACSAEQIHCFRGIFISAYGSSNIADFLSGDYKAIVELKEIICQIVNNDAFDRIKKYQLKCFIFNLSEIENKLK